MKPLVAIAAIALLAAPAAALAHAHAAATDPAKGASVKSPTAIHITFSEAVNPAFTGLEVDGPGGKVVSTAKPTFDPAKKVIAAAVASRLKPGAYTVKWHAVAADTHRSTGSFGFTVLP